MAKRVVTLDIDGTAIRLLEIKGRRVERWASASLEPGLVQDGTVVDPATLGARVKQLMRSSGIRGNKVVASLSGLHSLSRVLNIININPLGDLSPTFVAEEVRRMTPVSEDEFYLSWETIAASEEEQQALVVSALRGMVESGMQALRSAGVKPLALEPKAMALARTVNRTQALILNIEPFSTDIVIVSAGVPQIMHTISQQQDGLPDEDRAERIAQALEQAVNFYGSRYYRWPLDSTIPLFLTGRMAEEPALVEAIQARVEYPIEALAAPLEYPSYLPLSQYAVNIGLALGQLAPAKSRDGGVNYLPLSINLVPETHRRKLTVKQLYPYFAVVFAIVLLLPLYQVATGAMDKTNNLRDQLAFLNQRRELRQIEVGNRNQMTATVREYDTIIEKRGRVMKDLQVINGEAKRLGIQVTSVTHEGGKVTIVCDASEYSDYAAYHEAFDGYIAALIETGRFSSVEPLDTDLPPPLSVPITAKPVP